MLTALILTLALQPTPRPSIPPGTTRAFQESAYRAQEFISLGKFPEAEKALARIPTLEFKLEWDDSAVPAVRKAELRQARDAAIAAWESELPSIRVSIGKPGALKLSFAGTLPANADTSGPAGAVYFFNSPGPGPWVEGVLALSRTEQKISVEARDITNEVMFAIAQALGLERTKILRAATNRMEVPYPALNTVQSREVAIVERIQALRRQMSQAIQAKRTFQLARPQLALDTRELIKDRAPQGDVVPFSFLVTNPGDAILELRVVPDCGCLRVQAPSTLEPGGSAVVQAWVDTLEFPGNLHKNLLVYSNDPEASLRIIPVKLRSEPAFRFLREQGQAWIVGDQGAEGSVYLALNPERKFQIKKIEVRGLPAEISSSPWKGNLADPELGDPALPREGLKLDLKLPADIPPGRTVFSIVVHTDNEMFPTLEGSFFAQKGILMSPENLYLGQLKPVPTRAWGVVARPGQPFRVVRVESSSPSIKAFAESTGAGDTYKIVVQFDGKAELGPFSAELTVVTDDPKQPKIPFRVSAQIIR